MFSNQLQSPARTACLQNGIAALSAADTARSGEDTFSAIIAEQTPYNVAPLGLPRGTRVPTRFLDSSTGGGRTLRTTDGACYYLTSMRLGSGAFGDVCLAVDFDNQELVAAKEYRATDSRDPGESALWEVQNYHEGESLYTPYEVLIGPGMSQGFALMPLACGNLKTLLQSDAAREPRARAGLCLHTARGVARDLSRLHYRCMAHWDIKPDNIFYRGSRIALGDYGGTQPINSSAYAVTLAYTPPESLALAYAHGLDKVDMWALGVSLLEIGSNRPHLLWRLSYEIPPGHFSQYYFPHGAFSACYHNCLAESAAHSQDERLRMAIVLRAIIALHPFMMSMSVLLPVLPNPLAFDDPLRQLSMGQLASIQRAILGAVGAFPWPLRDLTCRLLSPDPRGRPAPDSVVAMLAAPGIRHVCHSAEGLALLKAMNVERGEAIAQAVLDEAAYLPSGSAYGDSAPESESECCYEPVPLPDSPLLLDVEPINRAWDDVANLIAGK